MEPQASASRAGYAVRLPAVQRHMDEFDSRAYRDTMGQFATGVVAVAGLEAGKLVGFAAQSFVSLSLSPPLIAVCPAKTSTSWPRLRTVGRFSINVLEANQASASDAFAQSGKTADIAWHKDEHGVPVLDGVLAYMACELAAEHDAGDHVVAVAKVVHFATLRPDAAPLVFFRGGYGLR